MDRQTAHGSMLASNRPPQRNLQDKIILDGKFEGKNHSFGMGEDLLNKHTLLVGSTGCGKTTLIDKMIDQIQKQMTDDDVMIIFDSKGDFYRKFGNRNKSFVIGNSGEYYLKSLRWNIFKEICADGWDDSKIVTNAQEICRILFAEREKRSNNPFFPNAARDLLASILIFLVRTGTNDLKVRNEYFYNDKLKRLLDRCDAKRILSFLNCDTDLRSVGL